MGCIMTPIPNHLSTCLSLPLNHKTTHKRVGERRAEQCGNGERCGNGVEQSVVMRLRGREIEQMKDRKVEKARGEKP